MLLTTDEQVPALEASEREDSSVIDPTSEDVWSREEGTCQFEEKP